MAHWSSAWNRYTEINDLLRISIKWFFDLDPQTIFQNDFPTAKIVQYSFHGFFHNVFLVPTSFLPFPIVVFLLVSVPALPAVGFVHAPFEPRLLVTRTSQVLILTDFGLVSTSDSYAESRTNPTRRAGRPRHKSSMYWPSSDCTWSQDRVRKRWSWHFLAHLRRPHGTPMCRGSLVGNGWLCRFGTSTVRLRNNIKALLPPDHGNKPLPLGRGT